MSLAVAVPASQGHPARRLTDGGLCTTAVGSLPAIRDRCRDEFPEGTVIRQTRRGYRMKDRLLRPPSVVVSSGAAT